MKKPVNARVYLDIPDADAAAITALTMPITQP
jgi:hypothetical protein